MCIVSKQILVYFSERKREGEKSKCYLIVRWEDELKDDHQPDKSWLGVMKTKRHEELFSTNQDSKKKEAQEGVHLYRNRETLTSLNYGTLFLCF